MIILSYCTPVEDRLREIMVINQSAAYSLSSPIAHQPPFSIGINTPLVANICYSIIKKIVSKELADTWRVGEKLPYDGRLDDLYNTPTPQHARQILLAKLEKYLTSRFKHEQEFSLSSATVVPADHDG